MLGLRFCARAFSSCGKRGPLFIAVRGPLTIAASLVMERRLQTRRLSSRGSRAQLLRGMWDPPGPGLKPVSPCIGRQTQPLRHQGSPYKLFIRSLEQFLIRFYAITLAPWPLETCKLNSVPQANIKSLSYSHHYQQSSQLYIVTKYNFINPYICL